MTVATAAPAGSWQAALHTFLDVQSSPGTRRVYGQAVRAAMKALRVEDLVHLDARELAGYRAGLVARLQPDRADRLSPGTVAVELAALRSFLAFARAMGLVRLEREAIREVLRSPTSTVRRPYQVLSAGERARFLEAAARRGLRDRALVVLALGSGLRAAELVSVQLGDFYQDDAGGWWLRVRQGKGRKDRNLPLHGTVIAVVEAWIQASGRRWADRDGWLFCSRQRGRVTPERARQIVRELALDAGIDKRITPHSLRHTFAIDLLRSGASPAVVQRLLGHASLATTQRYLDHLALGDLAGWAVHV